MTRFLLLLLLMVFFALPGKTASSSFRLGTVGSDEALAAPHRPLDPALRGALADEFRRFDGDGDGKLGLDDFLSLAGKIKGLRSASGPPTRDRCGRYLHKVCGKVDELPQRDVKRALLARMCKGCGRNVWSLVKGTILDRGSPADSNRAASMAAVAANFRAKTVGPGWKITPDGRKRYLTGAEYLSSLVSKQPR